MNDLQNIFAEIESHSFSAQVNVASNYKTFCRALGSQPEIQKLAPLMKSNEYQQLIFQRVLELSGRPFDQEFENPWDSALAAYVWLLAPTDQALAKMAAARILECHGCWWAKKGAEEVLKFSSIPSSSGSVGIIQPEPASQRRITGTA